MILDNTHFEACDIDSVNNGCIPPSYAVGLHIYEGSWHNGMEKIISKLFFFCKRNFMILIILIILLYIVKK